MADWIKVADRPPLRERQAEVTRAAPCSHGRPCRRKGGSEQTAERLDVRRARYITAGFEHGEGRLAPRNGGTAARSWRRQGQDARPGLPGRGRLAQHLDFHAVTTLSRRRLVIVTTGNEDKDPGISIYVALPRNFWAVFSLSPGPWMFEDPALLASASLSRHPMALLPTALAPSPRLPAASPRLCTCESLWRLRLDVF